MTPRHRRTTTTLALLAASVMAFSACGSSDDTSRDAAADGPTSTVATADEEDRDSDDADGLHLDAIDPVVQDIVDDAGISGAGLVVVDADDGLVFEAYWGAFGPDRISLIASTTKSITATVLVHLHDEGALDLDEPISAYVPWGAGNPDITVAQLLSNSSGLVGLTDNPAYPSYLCQFVGDELEACGSGIFTTEGDDDDIVAPDTRFRYGGAQWQVAGAVAEAVTGKPWAQLIDEILIAPCELESLGYNNHFTVLTSGGAFGYPDEFNSDPSVLPPTENPNMEGGAYIAPHDYAALLAMYLGDGRCGDDQVLSADGLDRLFTDRVATYGGNAGSDATGYGMGFFVDRSTGRVYDPGLYGARSWLDLDAGYGAYLVIEDGGATSGRILEAIEDPIHEAMADRATSTG